MPTWFAISISCLFIYLVFIVWAQIRFDSYRYALSYLQGSRLQLAPAIKSVGAHRPGDSLRTAVTLRNHGGSAVEVVGALADCSCIAYPGLPTTVGPGESVALPIVVRFRGEAGAWHQSITYLTNDFRQPRLRVDLDGAISPP